MSKDVKTLYITDGEDGIRVDRFFKRRWPHINHVQLNKLLRSGQVRVDGGRVKTDTRLATGQTIRVPPLPEAPDVDQQKRERAMLSPQEIRFAHSLVLYEDEDVIALNKPSGLAVQGGTKTKNHVDRLLSAWGEGLERPRLVHRLDRDTSGVLLLGKSPQAAARLSGAFAKRRAHKTYWALVVGNPKPEDGYIDTPLVKKGFHDREIVQPAEPNEPGAEVAETEYVTISRAGPRVAWMALRPHTGRTHQLRAHMQAIGHSILGDPKYGSEESQSLSAGLNLQLHHRRIELPHPTNGTLIVEAPLDPVIQAGFDRFGFDEHEAEIDPFANKKKKKR
ncbi:RluA family pseudouridine synthase [Asticcacaulis sp.]|uniref:RluA family pseudouridine synthase n=1 Tax=Asticcacaulis sp. TaxID=1872648 RepID=UPI003F7BB6A9